MKTHNGVHTGFARLMRDDRDLPSDLRGFLPRTFEMKSIADYGIGPRAAVFHDEAAEAIEAATRLVALVETKLGAAPP